MGQFQIKLLVCMVWTVMCRGDLTMKESDQFYSGHPGKSLEISCQEAGGEFPDECKFYRPDGNIVCDTDDKTSSQCVQDPGIQSAGVEGSRCVLKFGSIDPDFHFGTWKCEITSWYEVGVSEITVSEVEPAKVEFADIWGTWYIDMAKLSSVECSCEAISLDNLPLSYPPGAMTWTIGDAIVQNSMKYAQDSRGSWIQSLSYTPKFEDHGKILKCGLDDQNSDSVIISLTYFKPGSEKEEIIDANEGEAKTFTKIFSAFPEPTESEVFWILDTPKGEKKFALKQESKRFRSGGLENLGGNKYQTSLEIKKVAMWDNTATHRLVYAPSADVDQATMSMELNITVQPRVVPTPAPDPTFPTEKIVERGTSVPLNITTEGAEEAGTAGVSLYIIIAIVVLVVLLCVLFYCVRYFRKKDNNKVPNKEEDVEAPLMEKKENVDLNASPTEDKQRIEEEEKGLKEKEATPNSKMSNPEQKVENAESQKKEAPSGNVDTEASGAAPEQKVSGKVLPKDHPSSKDENEEIEKMAQNLRELSGDPSQESSENTEPKIKLESIDDKRCGVDPITPSPSESQESKEKTSNADTQLEKNGKDWKKNPLFKESRDPNPDDKINTKSKQVISSKERLDSASSDEHSKSNDGKIPDLGSSIESLKEKKGGNSKRNSLSLDNDPTFQGEITKAGLASGKEDSGSDLSKEGNKSLDSFKQNELKVNQDEGSNSSDETRFEANNGVADTAASPPAVPVSETSHEDKNIDWESTDDSLDHSKIMEQVEKIIEHVKGGDEVTSPSSQGLSPASKSMGSKSPTTEAATQTPRLKVKTFIFNKASSDSDEK